MGRVTWGQLEWFLSHNFDDGLQHRDVRCKDYVVIRNTNKKNTTSKNSSNKDRLLNFNTKLI